MNAPDWPPPVVASTRERRSWRRLARVVVPIVLLVVFLLVPIPVFYVFLPGPIRDVERLVEVSDASTYSSEGALFLTTVSVDIRATGLDLVAAAIDPAKQIVWKNDLTGGRSVEQLEQDNRRLMGDSKQHAEEVALSALGLGEPTGDGARVVATERSSPAYGVLEPDDVIVEVNRSGVETTCDVGEAIDRTEVGDEIELTVRRDGRLESVVLETARNPSDPSASYLGVGMTDVGYRFDPGLEVRFETGRIAGPSAGLMFTLALYDRLTPEDLTGGRMIAGTGEIDCGGGVGPIGGVVQKVTAAERRGAEVFLAPVANAEDARSVAGDIEIVAVSDFQDALDYLEGPIT